MEDRLQIKSPRHAVRGCMAVAAAPAGRLANSDSHAPRTPGIPAAATALARDPDTPGSIGVWVTPPLGNPGSGNSGAWSVPAPGDAGCREPGGCAGPESGHPRSLGEAKPAPRLPLTALRSGWRERLRADCLSRVQVPSLLHALYGTPQCLSAPSVLVRAVTAQARARHRLPSRAQAATGLASLVWASPGSAHENEVQTSYLAQAERARLLKRLRQGPDADGAPGGDAGHACRAGGHRSRGERHAARRAGRAAHGRGCVPERRSSGI